ncbi:MAG: YciI family protein, partial [Solirubrobacteraceae bacterium]
VPMVAARSSPGRQANSREEILVKYALLIYSKPGSHESLSESDSAAAMQEYAALSSDPTCLGGAQLEPPHTATTVQVQDGQMLTTDGPYADTKEYFGGYYVFEAVDLDAALALAGRIPAARIGGRVEVRPVVER